VAEAAVVLEVDRELAQHIAILVAKDALKDNNKKRRKTEKEIHTHTHIN
jgi:hypothetical protein